MSVKKKAVRESLEKARESSLLAVEIYNKPAIKFKSGAYIVLMIIAWSALFHAYFFNKNIKPFRRKGNGRFDKRDGDYLYWELGESIKEYFKDKQDPVRANLELFIPLRNKIEHKVMPEIDSNLFGECQALLLNFDSYIESFFGEKYCIRESLSFSLQLFPSLGIGPVKNLKSRDVAEVISFIEKYRSSTANSIISDPKYSFRAFLIQVANHPSKDALAIQFVNFDKLTIEQKDELSRFVAMIKYKEIPVVNSELLTAGKVVEIVQERLGNPLVYRKVNKKAKEIEKFNMSTHTHFWKKFKVRPSKKEKDSIEPDRRYCIYDKAHDDFLYTKEWIDFLVEKMNEPGVYDSLFYQKETN